MAHEMIYDRPREKLQRKGVAALTSGELLQLIIGSGNAAASVAWIARKTLKQLKKYGNTVSFDHLVSVKGLGPARASLIIAAFELVHRYQTTVSVVKIENDNDADGCVESVRVSTQYQIVYLTLDGDKRLITQRTILLHEEASHLVVQRNILADAMQDQAAGLYIAMGYSGHGLEPSMFELHLIKDIHSLSAILLLKIHGCVLMNSNDTLHLVKGSW
jgi:DNA repair protein RadC